jgi:hypothetical protein
MSLCARITSKGSDKIGVHRFGAAVREHLRGQTGAPTRVQLIAMFSLVGDDVTNLDALIATYGPMSTSNTANTLLKAARLDAMEDVFLLVETGDYTEAQAKTRLGF